MASSPKREDVVFLGVPCYGAQLDAGTSYACITASRTQRVVMRYESRSLLANCFNTLFATALTLRKPEMLGPGHANGVTHFCLMHGDVIPADPDWLSQMMEIMKKDRLDVLSVTIPIKDNKGIVSAGFDMSSPDELNPWRTRRLTTTEVANLPEVIRPWHAKKLKGWPKDREPVLLVNTGLMLIDIRGSWAEKLCFTINDQILFNSEKGVFQAFCEPEDWNMSRKLHELGVDYGTTRLVNVKHAGRFEYSNQLAWGDTEVDPSFPELVELTAQ